MEYLPTFGMNLRQMLVNIKYSIYGSYGIGSFCSSKTPREYNISPMRRPGVLLVGKRNFKHLGQNVLPSN